MTLISPQVSTDQFSRFHTKLFNAADGFLRPILSHCSPRGSRRVAAPARILHIVMAETFKWRAGETAKVIIVSFTEGQQIRHRLNRSQHTPDQRSSNGQQCSRILFRITSGEYSVVTRPSWMPSAVTWNILGLDGQDDDSIRLHSNLGLANKMRPPMGSVPGLWRTDRRSGRSYSRSSGVCCRRFWGRAPRNSGNVRNLRGDSSGRGLPKPSKERRVTNWGFVGGKLSNRNGQ